MRKWLRTFFSTSSHPERLRTRFQSQRDECRQLFFKRAANSGSPRGLRWIRCDWPDVPPILIQELATHEFSLLVSVNVSFEAVEGGDMEGVAAVSLVRDATAVFQWINGQWTTSGRTLFNMTPAESAERLKASHSVIASQPMA